jgi:hypothetical protein
MEGLISVEGKGVSGPVYLGVPTQFSICLEEKFPKKLREFQIVFADEAGNVIEDIEWECTKSENSGSGNSEIYSVTYLPLAVGSMHIEVYAGTKIIPGCPLAVNVVNPRMSEILNL